MGEFRTANEMFTAFMSDFGVTVDPADLPGPDTPIPPSNATRHILAKETGYGTPERQFTMLCGVSWRAGQAGGEHQYFFRDETWWHKHVTCQDCIAAMEDTPND